MRSVLAILFVVIFAIVTLPVLLVMEITHKKDPAKAQRIAHDSISVLFRGLRVIAGTTLHVSGLENIPKDTAVLYIGNHRSYFDIIYTYLYCPCPTSYVAKADLKNIPLFGAWGNMMRCLFFDRKNMKEALKMILDGIALIKEGTSVFIFPEGGRGKAKEQVPFGTFHDGSFKMAVKTGCPIIPVAIKNAADVWEGHSPWLKKCDVYISYLEPVHVSELDAETKKNIGEYIKGIMEKAVIASGTEAEATAD